MRTITLPRQTVINAASSRGITPCEEVSRLLSASFGREVCSHLKADDAERGIMIFSFGSRCVPIRATKSRRAAR